MRSITFKIYLWVCVLITYCFTFRGFHTIRLHPMSIITAIHSTSVESNEQTYEKIKVKIIESMKSSLSSKDGTTEQASIQLQQMMGNFLNEYASSNIAAGQSPEMFQMNIVTFFKSVQESMSKPYKFQPYHKAIREPFDYYKWGNDFLRPLMILERSHLLGKEHLIKMADFLREGHNIVLLSNHQTEADPQVLSVLLQENQMDELAEKIIFIAGHKVTNDPVAIPFSMGRNLLCIHSKKHIKNPPAQMSEKLAQNLLSMQAMGELAAMGGNIFWVAPSGGRDRPDETTGEYVVSPFDSKAMDMFKLIAMQSKKPMHFFPMAMYTHQLVPPPKSVSSSLGEERSAKRGEVSVSFLAETDGLGGLKDKEFTEEVQSRVDSAYKTLCSLHTK